MIRRSRSRRAAGLGARLAGAVIAGMLAPMPGHAVPQESLADGATRLDALDLRLPPSAGRPAHAAATAIPRQRHPTLRLEPRKSFIEQGVEGSREALIACQRGAYPGATVAASSVQTPGGDAQPDHCYRF